MPTAVSKLGSGNDVRGSNGSWGMEAVDENSREEKSKGGMASRVGKVSAGPGYCLVSASPGKSIAKLTSRPRNETWGLVTS
jgi:hypothetical protein